MSEDHYRAMFERELAHACYWQLDAMKRAVNVRNLNAACVRHKRTIRRLRDDVERMNAAVSEASTAPDADVDAVAAAIYGHDPIGRWPFDAKNTHLSWLEANEMYPSYCNKWRVTARAVIDAYERLKAVNARS